MSDDKNFGTGFLLGAGLLLLCLGAVVFAPFIGVLLASASIAMLLSPLHEALAARAPKRRSLVSAAFTATVALLAAVPLFLGAWTLLSEAADAYPAARVWLEAVSAPGATISASSPRLAALLASAQGWVETLKLDPRAMVLENLDRVSSGAGAVAKSLASNAAVVFLDLAVFVASLFLFLRDGARMVANASALIPLPEDEKEQLLSRVSSVLLAVAMGIFAIALLQGALAWIGLVLFRVPFAGLLGALCLVLSPIPFVGSALVWIPVALYTLAAGSTGKAAAIAAWFLIVVGLSDNLVRPILLGSQMKLPIPLVFIGVIGAMKAFGLAGLFVGPLVIALAYGFYDIIRARNPARRPAAKRAA